MGVTGVGLFADDVACDVRSAYREALEDGAEDADAERAVLEAAGFLDTRDREAPVIGLLDYASTDLPDAGTLALIPDRAALTPCVGATWSRQSSRRAGGGLTTSGSPWSARSNETMRMCLTFGLGSRQSRRIWTGAIERWTARTVSGC
jgi:hypothetical protein